MAILTVSREFGSGGREIGRAVAEALHYEYIDKAAILSGIRAAGKKWEEWGKDLDEHCPTVWEKYDWSFRGFGALIQSLIMEHALNDRVVIMGRGGNFLLKDIPYALRIRVAAPLEKRVERIMERESVDRETAHWLVEKTDKGRASFIHVLYGKRWDDPEEYDMIFNTGDHTLEEITERVKKGLMDREKFNTREAKELLRMRSLAAKVKAGIATDPGIFIPVLDVDHVGEGLVLRGVIHNPKEHKRVEDAARKIAGDVPIRCELHYRR
jgi:cytidylate kinase